MIGCNKNHATRNMKHATKNTKSKIQSNRRRRLFHVSYSMFYEKGFTLIELLMAMSIFALTTTVIVAVFLSMTAGHRRSLNAITLDNAAYIAMETIAKEIRTGRVFECISGTPGNCDEIRFDNYHGDTVRYKQSGVQIEKICDIDISGVCATGMITPSNISISYLKFDLEGTNIDGVPDNKQSKINIVLTAQTPAGTPEKYQRTLNLQTTISSRNLDS